MSSFPCALALDLPFVLILDPSSVDSDAGEATVIPSPSTSTFWFMIQLKTTSKLSGQVIVVVLPRPKGFHLEDESASVCKLQGL